MGKAKKKRSGVSRPAANGASIVSSNGDKPGCFQSRGGGIARRVYNEKDMWRYYITEHQCLHFKGTGHINNYYILGRYLTEEGDIVKNKKTLMKAINEGTMSVNVDYAVSNQFTAIALAKKKFYPEEALAPVMVGGASNLSF